MALGHTKFKKLSRESASLENNFVTKARLNVNDLLQRRKAERAEDKKINLIIVAGISSVAAVILIVFSF